MIQIAWILCDTQGNRLSTEVFIIKPVGFTIPEEASNIHGITTAIALSDGLALMDVLTKFKAAVERANYIVAHNISFDEKIMGAELLRNEVDSNFENIRKLCTMKSSTEYCSASLHHNAEA